MNLGSRGPGSIPSRGRRAQRNPTLATPPKLTPLQETEARRLAEAEARANKVPGKYSEEERAARKERVAKAKDAMSRSVGLKGAHVAPARAAIKRYLQRLNKPNQPYDAQFEALIEAPFKAPPKKKTNDRRF
jgi:hypothetical protein